MEVLFCRSESSISWPWTVQLQRTATSPGWSGLSALYPKLRDLNTAPSELKRSGES
ncbi:MAG: hypothetical protein J07HR59_01695, partial [Halorubrum sp. J07HR59]